MQPTQPWPQDRGPGMALLLHCHLSSLQVRRGFAPDPTGVNDLMQTWLGEALQAPRGQAR